MNRVVKTAAVLIGMVMIIAMQGVGATPARAVANPSVKVGMAFAGKWAYNVNVNPPYSDANSSHPSVHHVPGGGDWATDLYAPAEGTPVRLRLTDANGLLSYEWMSSSTGCGASVRIKVKVDGAAVGWIYFAHLSNAVTSGPISLGMQLGVVKNLGCNPGRHIHVEFRNLVANHSCWYGFGNPGTSVGEGTAIGKLGSSNSVPQQQCGPDSPPPPQPPAARVGARVGNILYSANSVGNWVLLSNTAGQGNWKAVGARTGLLDSNGLWINDNAGAWTLWGSASVQEFAISPYRVVARIGNLLYSSSLPQQWELVSNTASQGNWQLVGNNLALLDANGLWLKVGASPWELASNSAVTGKWQLTAGRLAVSDANGIWVRGTTTGWTNWHSAISGTFQISDSWVAIQDGNNLYVSATPGVWSYVSNTATTDNWKLSGNRLALLDPNGLWTSTGNGGFTMVSNTAVPGQWQLTGDRLAVLDGNGLWAMDGFGPWHRWAGSDVVEFSLG